MLRDRFLGYRIKHVLPIFFCFSIPPKTPSYIQLSPEGPLGYDRFSHLPCFDDLDSFEKCWSPTL